MIIDPYKVEETKRNYSKKENIEDIVEKNIKFLITNYKNLIENIKYNEIKTVLLQYLQVENIKTINTSNDVIIKKTIDKLFGYGILQKYIDDETTTDIRAVAYDSIYIKKFGKWQKADVKFKDNNDFDDYIRYTVLKNGGNINYEKPIAVVSDRKNNLRIEAGIDPVNVRSSSIVIRIHKQNEEKTLEYLYAKQQMINKSQYEFLIGAINELKNILIVGKGGSGKTTLLRAIIQKIPNNVAISTNEETAEININGKNIIQREILNRNTEEKSIDLEILTRHALVMSNDVIVIGELKGKEASTFFDAISTGHIGYTTIHADSVENSVDRMIVLIKKDIKAQSYTDAFLRRFIVSSLHYVIYMKDYVVDEIASLCYNDSENRIIKNVVYKHRTN